MKLFLILIFNSLFIFVSCKCNCEGGAPVISAANEKLIICKNDSVIHFIKNQTEAVAFSVSRGHSEIKPKDVSMNFRKSCDCPNDYLITDGYTERIDTIDFGLRIETYKDGSAIRYGLNSFDFFTFDSTNISRTINDKVISGLSLKNLPANFSASQIYYKDSLGLVSIVYRDGTIIDLK